MSTPSPQPLDYDLISPYAPKHVREQTAPALVADSESVTALKAAARSNRIRTRRADSRRYRGQSAGNDRRASR